MHFSGLGSGSHFCTLLGGPWNPFGDHLGALLGSLGSLWAPMETPWPLLGTPWDTFGTSEDPIWHLWELFGPSLGPLEGPWASTRDPLRSFFKVLFSFWLKGGCRIGFGRCFAFHFSEGREGARRRKTCKDSANGCLVTDKILGQGLRKMIPLRTVLIAAW